MAVNGQALAPKDLAQIEKQVDVMTDVMQLNDEQKEKVLLIKKVMKMKLINIDAKLEKNSVDYIAAQKSAYRSFRMTLDRICSSEQVDLWKAYKKARKEKGK